MSDLTLFHASTDWRGSEPARNGDGQPCPTCGHVALASLDARPRHHSDGPATERSAANLAWPKAGTNRRRILDALHRSHPGGFTADELSALLGMHSARQRLNDLKAGGWVQGTGQTRETRQGAPAEVYVLTGEALQRTGGTA